MESKKYTDYNKWAENSVEGQYQSNSKIDPTWVWPSKIFLKKIKINLIYQQMNMIILYKNFTKNICNQDEIKRRTGPLSKKILTSPLPGLNFWTQNRPSWGTPVSKQYMKVLKYLHILINSTGYL